MIPLKTWYPAMHTKWQARLAELRARGVKVDFALSERIGWTIHHTVGGIGVNATAYARSVADQHWAQWRRPGGYNFMVGWDGQIREMCGYLHEGAHAGTNQWNEDTLGLAFQGDFRNSPPPGYMLSAGGGFIGATPIPTDQWTHREVRPTFTTCPGDALIAELPLEPTMTKDEILKTLGITQFDLDTLQRTNQGYTDAKIGRTNIASVVAYSVRLWRNRRRIDELIEGDAGGGVSEDRVKELIRGSTIRPPG